MAMNKIISRTLHTVAGLHIREAAEGEASRTITGYAILFNTPSAAMYADETEEIREVIAPGAVTRELLDSSDIKMTLFHDNHLLLARSKQGSGTLSYGIDDRGVYFEFEAPHTADGDKALELVRRGDIAGCSFAFTTYYYNKDYVARSSEKVDGKTVITYTVNAVTGIYDFTLTPDPAYPDTTCVAELRDLAEAMLSMERKEEKMREQVREMRRAATAAL